MFKLLNRFAWILSLSFWFIIAFVIIGSNGYRINWEDIFFSWFFWVIAWLIIKKVLFSKTFIQDRLEFFANSLEKNYINTNKNSLVENTNIFEKPNNEKSIEEENEILTTNLEELEETEIKNTSIEENIKERLNTTEEEKLEIENYKNSQNYTTYQEPSVVSQFIDKVVAYIKDFFSTNLLAKLWWILIFLWVVYLLKWVFLNLWPVAKLTMWILIGFAVYWVWVKIHNKYEKEAIVLMWIWILINYAVILSGRYLLWDNWYLSDTTTFLFLILNTIFAILTSLIYNSGTLLIFSFIFAYLNPFIIWAESNWQPYVLIWYSLIISLAWLFLSLKRVNLTLLAISFLAWNFLFLVAPFSDSIWWSFKIIFTSILSLLSITQASKFRNLENSTNKIIVWLFIWAYIFVILNLVYSKTFLSETISFVIYNIILISLFIFSIRLINTKLKITDWNSIMNIFIFLPLIILVWILVSWNLLFSPYVLISTIVIYLITFSFLKNLSDIFSYIFFAVLWFFVLFFNIDIRITQIPTTTEFLTLIITSLIFLFSTYKYSLKESLSKLFSIWTIWTIVILASIVVNNSISKQEICTGSSCDLPTTTSSSFMTLSIIAIAIFALANLILPFINKQLLKKENLGSLITWVLTWAMFFAFQIYNFWEIHFPWVLEGYAFLALAIIYFLEAYFIVNELWIENVKNDESLKNVFYTFIWVSISIFSIAIAFIFANHPEIITTTWLFEATILYFFYSKTSNVKIFWWATILLLIWLTKFWILLDVVKSKEYWFLISFVVILVSFILNLYFINKVEIKNDSTTKDIDSLSYHNIHHILHLIWMWIMWWLLLKIIPSTGHWWSMLWVSIFITFMWSFYARFNFKLIKSVFIIILGLFAISHIWEINYIFWRLDRDNLINLKILQYIVSIVIISNYIIWKKFNTNKYFNKAVLIIVSIYWFIISNIYALDLFKDIFGYYTLTIYWGLIASALLLYWIQKDIIKYRTIWLYFLTLTSAKIFLYDIWQISDTNSRVIVFIILWIIFIIISTMYTKRFWDNMKWEFSLDNLKSDDINDDGINSYENTKKQEFTINQEIKDIDVSKYKWVKFIFNNWKSISIRSENLIKIAKLVTENNKKTSFKKNELKTTYDYIVNNYKTELSKANYKKILEIMEKFVEFWGEVKFIEK